MSVHAGDLQLAPIQLQEGHTSAFMGCSSSLVCTSLPSVSIMMATENLHINATFAIQRSHLDWDPSCPSHLFPHRMLKQGGCPQLLHQINPRILDPSLPCGGHMMCGSGVEQHPQMALSDEERSRF